MKMKAIALNTFREAIRDRILYVILFFAAVCFLFSRILALLTVGDQVKIITDVGLAALSFFGEDLGNRFAGSFENLVIGVHKIPMYRPGHVSGHQGFPSA